MKMVTADELEKITTKAKRLVRASQYLIGRHATDDYPERQIAVADILECLKIGNAVAFEPQVIRGQLRYRGNARYRWFGEDQKDRVLRLIVIVTERVIVVSAAHATPKQAERYHAEDTKEK
jgi:hypothetical protein